MKTTQSILVQRKLQQQKQPEKQSYFWGIFRVYVHTQNKENGI